jgi:predicted ATPase
VLRRVKEVARAATAAGADPATLFRRAATALRDLLAKLAHTWPLVLWLDDLQWGDADSARLLADAIRPAEEAIPLLLLAGSRAGDEGAFLSVLQAAVADLAVVEVTVAALTPLEASSLAQTLLADSAAAGEAVADLIAKTSQGWPVSVIEQARHFQQTAVGERSAPDPSALTLERVLAARLRKLPDAAVRLLEVLTVAGQPLPVGLARVAADSGGDTRAALTALRAAHLAQEHNENAFHTIECSHDCVREAVLGLMTADQRAATHDRLARALAATHSHDHALMAAHCVGAGRTAEAAYHYALAAEEAELSLAFSRAIQLFRLSIELMPPGAAEVPALRAKLATCERQAV